MPIDVTDNDYYKVATIAQLEGVQRARQDSLQLLFKMGG